MWRWAAIGVGLLLTAQVRAAERSRALESTVAELAREGDAALARTPQGPVGALLRAIDPKNAPADVPLSEVARPLVNKSQVSTGLETRGGFSVSTRGKF